LADGVGIDNNAEEEKMQKIQINHRHEKLLGNPKSGKTIDQHTNSLLSERLQERRRESSQQLYTMTLTD